MAYRVSINDLRNKVTEMENTLINQGFNVKINSYFAYGVYGYYFDFYGPSNEHKQLYTGLGTKKECLNNMDRCFYEAIANKNYYSFNEEV